MRAALTTSNLAATQLFKSNRKQRETEEVVASYIASGRHVIRESSAMNLVKRTLSEHGHVPPRHHHDHDQHHPILGSQRLRAAKLRGLAKEEICLESMRKLFRLLDEDQGGTLDPQELKKGMEMLGFQEVADPVALDRLVREIDEDKTGTIEENEFLAYFSHETRASLHAKLKSWSLDLTHIKATRYRSKGKPEVDVAEVQAGSAGSWIKETFSETGGTGYNYWLDVTGYDRATFTEMAQALGFTHDDLASLLVFQNPECRTLEGERGAGAVFIMPSAKLSLNPVPWSSGLSWTSKIPGPVKQMMRTIFGHHVRGVPNYLESRRLAGKSDIADITISLEQAAILVANESLVLTFRNPIHNYEASQLSNNAAASRISVPVVWHRCFGHGLGLKRSTTVSMIETSWGEGSVPRARGSAVAPDVNPFAAENSTVRLQFEWLRGKLASQCPSTCLAANSDVKMLAVLLVDQLLSSNYVIRDRVQDWEELIEASIRGVESSASMHLEAMGGLLDRFIDHLEPLAKILSPDAWDDDDSKADHDELASSKKEEPAAEGEKKVVQRTRKLGATTPAIEVTPVTGVAGPPMTSAPPRSARRSSAQQQPGGSSSPPISARRPAQALAAPDAPSPRSPRSRAPPSVPALQTLHASKPSSDLPPPSPPDLSPAPSTDRDDLRRSLAPFPKLPLARSANGSPRSPRSPRRDPGLVIPGLGMPGMMVPAGLQRGLDRPSGWGDHLGWQGALAWGCSSPSSPPRLPGHNSPQSKPSSARSRGGEKEESEEREGEAGKPLHEFFAGQLEDFEEIAADVLCLVQGSLARHERVDNLSRRLNNAKQDMINRTLYALTLVTAIATPVTICTGIYGMNFDDMPELDPTVPGSEGYGYSFFWKVIATVVSSMLFLLFRLGLFKTLL